MRTGRRPVLGAGGADCKEKKVKRNRFFGPDVRKRLSERGIGSPEKWKKRGKKLCAAERKRWGPKT